MNIQDLYFELVTNKLSLGNALALSQVYVPLTDEEKKWVDLELNGYNSKLIIPEYRQLPCEVKARVQILYNGEIQELNLVGSAIDELDATLNSLHGLSIYKLYAGQGIEYLESQAINHEDGNVIMVIDGPPGRDMKEILKVQAKRNGYSIINVFQTAPVAYLQNTISVIKTRLMGIIKGHMDNEDQKLTNVVKPSSDVLEEVKDEKMMEKKHSIFISYSHEDEKWLVKVQKTLKSLQRYYDNVDSWSDKKINASDVWKEKIDRALGNATIAILLVSPDFMASDFITNEELQPILNKAVVEGTKILTLILRPTPLLKESGILKYQAVNDPKKPLSGMTEYEQEMVLVNLADAIKKIIDVNEPKKQNEVVSKEKFNIAEEEEIRDIVRKYQPRKG